MDSPEDQNTEAALVGAFTSGFGVETDLRDHNGEIVISHDLPLNSVRTFASLCDRLNNLTLNEHQLLALNVKADGLEVLLTDPEFPIPSPRHFYFDMSFPSLRRFRQAKLPVAPRVSEFENLPAAEDSGGFLWIDAFVSDWFLDNPALEDRMKHTTACLVSPEIHGRDPQQAWAWLSKRLNDGCDAYLCTDLPFEALGVLS